VRILLVDDHLESAASLGEVLRHWGHEVALAQDGFEALEAALQWRPHLVLLDIGLPEVDGYEVARALRSRPELRGMLLVAITGYGQAEDRRRAREAGFHAHCTKPVDLVDLQEILALAEH
jgi:CheY-like chemotaxis protein